MRGERVYTRLLLLYPPAFRRRYRDELMAFYREHREEPRFAGRRGAIRFWRHTISDLLRTAASEWTATLVGLTRAGPGTGAGTSHGRRLLAGGARDLRYGGRSLARDPVFAVVSVLTLALGIGATTSVFAVVRGVLLAPLGFPGEHRLVRIYELELDNPGARMVAYGNYADLRAAGLFDELAIWAYSSHTLTGVERALQLRSREVSSNFAATLGMRPRLGRWIGEDEERQGRHVVVLSHALWQTVFGGVEDVIGGSVLLDGEPYDVIGVMEAGFDFPNGADAWVPLQPVTDVVGRRRWHRHNMVGRLPAGVEVGDVNRRLAPFARELEEAYPDTNAGNYFEARPLLETIVGHARPALRALFGAVVLLLLIACVNIASLAHARALSREPELAVRTALGASAFQLGRLLLIEATLLAAVGGAVGLMVARLGVKALVALSAGSIPRSEAIAFDLPVFLFVAGATALTSLAVVATPLWQLRRRTRSGAAALHGGRVSAGRGAARSRRVLVIAELALALVLTVGAGLLIRSFDALVSVDPGIELDRLLALELRLPGGDRYGTREAVARFLEDLADRLETVPGVERVAAMLTPPLDDRGWYNSLTMRDRPISEAELPPIEYNVVSSGFFETVGARLLEGRTFTPGEPRGGHLVAVVNRTAAERHWPGESAVGKLVLGDPEGDSLWVEVVGVVADVRQSLTEPTHPAIYVPVAQDRVLSFTILARTQGDAMAAARPLESTIRDADPDIPIRSIEPFSERVGALTARPRFSATLMGGFAGLALTLACVGVFGLLVFTVAQRRQEFGIRMALGAGSARVVGSVLLDAAMMSATAIVIGLVGSYLLSRLLASLLFGVTPTDAVSFAGAAAAIVFVTVVAALWPARAATAVDPLAVLREE